MKLPDNPGKIMAQIAIIPEKKIEKKSFDNDIGLSVVIKNPKKIPINKNKNSIKLKSEFLNEVRKIDNDEKITKPKNNEKTWIGKLSYALDINETNKKIEQKIPTNNGSKNFKL